PAVEVRFVLLVVAPARLDGARQRHVPGDELRLRDVQIELHLQGDLGAPRLVAVPRERAGLVDGVVAGLGLLARGDVLRVSAARRAARAEALRGARKAREAPEEVLPLAVLVVVGLGVGLAAVWDRGLGRLRRAPELKEEGRAAQNEARARTNDLQ